MIKLKDIKRGKQCKVFIGTTPTLVDEDLDEYFEVDTYIKGMKLEKDKGYILGDYVYVFYGKYNENKTNRSGIYKKDNDYIVIEHNEKTMEKYHISNLNELNPQSILSLLETDRDNFVQMEDIEIINNNAEIYTPMIKEEDDFLKYIVKKMIINKKINLRNYREKFPNEYALNNMKSGLNKSTKMTVTNFTKWCEVLGCDWRVVVKDNNTDVNNPMTEDIVVDSRNF